MLCNYKQKGTFWNQNIQLNLYTGYERKSHMVARVNNKSDAFRREFLLGNLFSLGLRCVKIVFCKSEAVIKNLHNQNKIPILKARIHEKNCI